MLLRLVVVTPDGSEWLLDSHYVEGLWREYCSDIAFVLDPCDFENEENAFLYLLRDDVSSSPDWLAYARLVTPSAEMRALLEAARPDVREAHHAA